MFLRVVFRAIRVLGVRRRCYVYFTESDVARVAAFGAYRLKIGLGRRVVCSTYRRFVNVATPFVSFRAKIATARAFRHGLADGRVNREHLLLVFRDDDGVGAANATSVRFTFILEVGIRRGFPLRDSKFRARYAVRSHFFVLNCRDFR